MNKVPESAKIESQTLEQYKGFELKTKNGYRLDEVVSALQKEIRRGNELMAKYWALEMNESGFWRYCFRRLQVIAGEDIGLANPEAMTLVSSTFSSLLLSDKTQKYRTIDNNVLGMVVVYMTRCQKSRHIDYLGGLILKKKEKGWHPEVPTYAIDQHTRVGKEMGMDDSDFFREGSRIKNKKHIEGEDGVKSDCLSLYGFTDKRNEGEF